MRPAQPFTPLAAPDRVGRSPRPSPGNIIPIVEKYGPALEDASERASHAYKKSAGCGTRPGTWRLKRID
jgi:hypothetical protein